MNKPKADHIYGISPAVAIEQKAGAKNPRSTVGTSTEVYDYLRLLFARIGKTICFNCGKVVTRDSVKSVAEWLESQNEGAKFYLTFPLQLHEGRNPQSEIEHLKRRGFFRIIIDNKYFDLNDSLPKVKINAQIFSVIDRIKIKRGTMHEKMADSIETTFKEGYGRLTIIDAEKWEKHKFNKFYECCGIRYEEPEPRFFSFNNPFGACPVCQGFGRTVGYDMDLIVPNSNLSISEGAIAPWRTPKFSKILMEP